MYGDQGHLCRFRILKALIYSEVPLTSELKTLGLYNFVRGFRRPCGREGLKPNVFFCLRLDGPINWGRGEGGLITWRSL